jgi:glycosyltransferase involved in cell wall biosynthesis
MHAMSRRMRVFLSAFACEPHKGSEPEVGWQWALQMARFHDVTVLTQSKNRAGIESTLKSMEGGQPQPHFIYYDLPGWLQRLRKFSLGLRIYYVLWQRWARAVVRREHRQKAFDLLHHVTFAAFRYPAVIWGHGVPCIWGPVGGIESIPTPLLPWDHPISFIEEVFRNASNLIQSTPYNDLPKRAAASNTVLASTLEMRRSLEKLGLPSQLMPTIGLRTRELPYQGHRQSDGPLRILFVGKIITLKGIDLALKALRDSGTDASLTLVGTGNYLPAARRFVEKAGLKERVTFRGQLPREQVLKIYSDFDVMLFPSLHDTGGYAVIEAMFNELPVICLDCGGPAVAVREGCGIRVPVGSRQSVIEGLAAAIRYYDGNRQALCTQGKAARETILEHYDWDKKGTQMNVVYEETLTQAARQPPGDTGHTRAARRLFSFRGSVAAGAILLLVGMLGFISLDHLKNEAALIVDDTLPGLSYSGEANAYIVDASRTLLFVTDKDADRRKKIQDDINVFSARTTKYLLLYRNSIYTEEDRTNFQKLIQMRSQYIQIRNRVLGLAKAGRENEAIVLYNNSLMPAHSEVKKAGDKLFEYNMRQGQERGKKIMAFCTVTQVVLAVASVLIFAIGFFFGLFK